METAVGTDLHEFVADINAVSNRDDVLMAGLASRERDGHTLAGTLKDAATERVEIIAAGATALQQIVQLNNVLQEGRIAAVVLDENTSDAFLQQLWGLYNDNKLMLSASDGALVTSNHFAPGAAVVVCMGEHTYETSPLGNVLSLMAHV